MLAHYQGSRVCVCVCVCVYMCVQRLIWGCCQLYRYCAEGYGMQRMSRIASSLLLLCVLYNLCAHRRANIYVSMIYTMEPNVERLLMEHTQTCTHANTYLSMIDATDTALESAADCN